MSFLEGEGKVFPSLDFRVSSEEVMAAMIRASSEAAKREIWKTKLEDLVAAVSGGTRTIKPGHRVLGIEGSGRGQTEPISVPLTERQLSRRQKEIKILSKRIGRV